MIVFEVSVSLFPIPGVLDILFEYVNKVSRYKRVKKDFPLGTIC